MAFARRCIVPFGCACQLGQSLHARGHDFVRFAQQARGLGQLPLRQRMVARNGHRGGARRLRQRFAVGQRMLRGIVALTLGQALQELRGARRGALQFAPIGGYRRARRRRRRGLAGYRQRAEHALDFALQLAHGFGCRRPAGIPGLVDLARQFGQQRILVGGLHRALKLRAAGFDDRRVQVIELALQAAQAGVGHLDAQLLDAQALAEHVPRGDLLCRLGGRGGQRGQGGEQRGPGIDLRRVRERSLAEPQGRAQQ